MTHRSRPLSHILLTVWLRPSKQIRAPLFSTKQKRQRRWIVSLLYFCLNTCLTKHLHIRLSSTRYSTLSWSRSWWLWSLCVRFQSYSLRSRMLSTPRYSCFVPWSHYAQLLSVSEYLKTYYCHLHHRQSYKLTSDYLLLPDGKVAHSHCKSLPIHDHSLVWLL